MSGRSNHFRFEVVARDRNSCARVGRLCTPHGVVDTPVFMPVGTAGTVKAMTQEGLEALDAQLLLANSYHLLLRPGPEVIQELGGLHRFMGWPRALLTDSGGFQVFSMNTIRKVSEDGVTFRSHLDGSQQFLSPEKAIQVQVALGADLIMVLDECLAYPASREKARQSMELTLRWAKRCQAAFAKQEFTGQALFGIVQGGTYTDLRRECARRLVETDFPGYAIGGLAVGEPAALSYEMTEASVDELPEEKPRYLMGVGYPLDLVEYTRRGVDLMDCVLPTRNARNGYLFTRSGVVHTRNSAYARDGRPIDERCACAVCRRYSRAYLRHLFNAGEILAATLATHHNLFFYLDLMRRIRQAIREGTLDALAGELKETGESADR
ncbi:MAG: tRNA guanosine(34) transglycosylase Tgt [Acidobacteria bacterium]|nr:tRNA guanosine(34) transglycosylase Tgt [Acidobacteriota bacterium]